MTTEERRGPRSSFHCVVMFGIMALVARQYFVAVPQRRQDDETFYAEAFRPLESSTKEERAEIQRLTDEGASLRKQLKAVESRLDSLEQQLKTTNKDVAATLEQPVKRVTSETSSSGSTNESFCVSWKVNTDEWWTHHVDWVISAENKTHYCFSPMQDQDKAEVFRNLYNIQFFGDCANVTTKRMWSSGWGADMDNVIDGLQYALETKSPMQVTGRWHYAASKINETARPACPTKDMYCYFLNMTSCRASKQPTEADYLADVWIDSKMGRWLLEYATRPQTWLRHKVYQFSKRVKLKTPCTVIHVRRGDIVLHDETSRRYRPIADYVHALDNITTTKNILLLTDDHNAIGEALTNYPDYNWMYIDRPRHKGAEGGWENQLPSDEPSFEVIVLLSIFRLVRQCSTLIHTKSNFAGLLKTEMRDGIDFKAVDLDAGDPNVHSANNTLSVNISKAFD